MLRNEALSLLNEITSTYPDLLANATHLGLQLSEGDTRSIIKSRLDFEQKTTLLGVLNNKGLKVVNCPCEYETILVIY